MILPIILSYNFLNNSNKKLDGLWIFYKFLDFALKNDKYIIGREIYYEDTKERKNMWDTCETNLKYYNYKIPNNSDLNKLRKYSISNDIEEYFLKNNITLDYLLKNNDKNLELEINKKIDKIEEDSKQKIEIIITWYPLKTIEKICKDRNIILLNEELTTIRKEWYNFTLGTISKNSKYNAYDDFKKYNTFKRKKLKLLTREELIIIFSKSRDLYKNLKILKSKSKYEIGYILGLNNDPYEKAYCKLDKNNIINALLNNFDSKNIIVRKHPQAKTEISNNVNIDNSPNAREFISKCDKIIVSLSNVGYESMLYGKKVTNLCENFLTAFGKQNDVAFPEDSVIPLEKLNFITFYLYTPFEKLFDYNYIKELTYNRKDISEIYNDNQKCLFKKFNIDFDAFFRKTLKERKNYLLEKVHGLNIKKIMEINNIEYGYDEEKHTLIKKMNELKQFKQKQAKKNFELNEVNRKQSKDINILKNIYEKQIKETYNLNETLKKKEKEILEQKKIIDELNITLKNIYESKSWKITQPLRKIILVLKRRFK